MTSPDKLRPLPDTQAEIERIFLWDIIKGAFGAHADEAGLQASFELTGTEQSTPTRFVLVSPAAKIESDDCDLKLWGDWAPGQGINTATLTYNDADTGRELWTYHIDAQGMDQYPAAGMERTPLDAEDVRDIRDDVERAQWSQTASEACAENVFFWSAK